MVSVEIEISSDQGRQQSWPRHAAGESTLSPRLQRSKSRVLQLSAFPLQGAAHPRAHEINHQQPEEPGKRLRQR